MNAAINFAWVNRQLIMHRTRQVFERVFDRSWESMEMDLLYDVAHNIAKKDPYRERRGATSANSTFTARARRERSPPATRRFRRRTAMSANR